LLKAPKPQDGVAIVTGATGGLGLETALGLARAGFEVLVTGRDEKRGERAMARIRAAVPTARLRFAMLDVASLASVREFAAVTTGPVAVLVNNAGVMALPQRALTEDGFERQIGTNYLGHFALTGLLLDRLRGGRVVNVSSLAHRNGRIAFDDFMGATRYDPWAAYQQSKLAMLMFGLELQRRSVAGGWGVTSITAHPGWSATQIVLNGPGGGAPGLRARIMQAGFSALGQSAAAGALPELYAALDDGAKPGGYYGPCCLMETRGRVAPSKIMPQARNAADCARLWEMSEALTGVPFAPPGPVETC
jgi:NAD(P)-dependent dehydrogenase (short-subunit alcohol dehydrogenase family)